MREPIVIPQPEPPMKTVVEGWLYEPPYDAPLSISQMVAIENGRPLEWYAEPYAGTVSRRKPKVRITIEVIE